MLYRTHIGLVIIRILHVYSCIIEFINLTKGLDTLQTVNSFASNEKGAVIDGKPVPG